ARPRPAAPGRCPAGSPPAPPPGRPSRRSRSRACRPTRCAAPGRAPARAGRYAGSTPPAPEGRSRPTGPEPWGPEPPGPDWSPDHLPLPVLVGGIGLAVRPDRYHRRFVELVLPGPLRVRPFVGGDQVGVPGDGGQQLLVRAVADHPAVLQVDD